MGLRFSTLAGSLEITFYAPGIVPSAIESR